MNSFIKIKKYWIILKNIILVEHFILSGKKMCFIVFFFLCFMGAFPLITNFRRKKNVSFESQISNIVFVEYFILLGKKIFYSNYLSFLTYVNIFT